MTEVTLQPGERLRIRSGRLLLVRRLGLAWEISIVKRGAGARVARAALAWWLRTHRRGAAIARRFLEARRENAQARLLAQLDARTLKDIGLEAHHGSALAERIDARRRRELLRTFAGRLGL